MAGYGAPRTINAGRPRPRRLAPDRPWARTGPAAVHAQPAVGVPPATQAPWVQPPIPAGAYNPIRDIELAAGKRGLSNTLEDIGTRGVRGEQGYLIGKEGIEREKAEQADNHAKALAALQQSYQRLGVRQGEQANTAGVLRGGALLQAAAKRATNEGKTRDEQNQAAQRTQEGLQRQLGQLTTARQQEGEDLTTQGSRAEREQAQFGIDTTTLEGREAAENGYIAPQAPNALAAAHRAPPRRPGGGGAKALARLRRRRW